MLIKSRQGKTIGVLGCYKNLNGEFKYGEISQITFEYPAYDNGKPLPFYDSIVGDKLIQIDPYGIYILRNPETTGDGIFEKKRCTAYSMEYELSGKTITLESGTFKFYNPINPKDKNTLLGRVLENARNWKIGSIASNLWARYRIFDETEIGMHSFLIDTVQKAYGCVFVFDSYTRTIHAVDTDTDVSMVPVYLSHDNLIKEVTVTEANEDMFTKLSVYGADPLSIRDVNPIGSNYIYNIDHYIANGDISIELALRWRNWQSLIRATQPYYISRIMLRYTTDARYLSENAFLKNLEEKLVLLDNLRSDNIQGKSMATIPGPASQYGTIAYFENELVEIANRYKETQHEIKVQQDQLDDIQNEYNAYSQEISETTSITKIESFFTSDELSILEDYFQEDNFVDNTFAVFKTDISKENDSFAKITSASITLSDIYLEDIPMSGIWACKSCGHHFSASGRPSECPACKSTNIAVETSGGHRMFDIAGGSISISGTQTKMNQNGNTASSSYSLSAGIVSAILDCQTNGALVFSLYLDSGTANGASFPSGNLTISCQTSLNPDAFLNGLKKVSETIEGDVDGVTYEDIHYEGAGSFQCSSGSIYFTCNVTEAQSFSVVQELYNYATKCLKDISSPTYSFEMSTANPIYAKEFEPFKNALRLGSGCYIQLSDNMLTKQILLEVHIDFEDPTKFSMVFSNKFKHPSDIANLRGYIEEARSANRTLNLDKFNFGSWQNSGAFSALDQFFQDGLQAAYQQLLAGVNNSVTIGGFGIKISSSDSDEYIHINNGMIALIDGAGKTARMAMGHFKTDAGQDYYGILADVIAGKLLAGKNLLIECESAFGGITQFKVDGSGVFINNGRMYFQSDKGGKIGLDPKYGFFQGTSSLFNVTSTGIVKPSFIDSSGRVMLDSSGFPVNTNVWIGIDGQAYFRGTVYATDGVFNGTIYATDGKFSGVVQASAYLDSSGNNMMNSQGQWNPDYLNLKGLNINNNFIVDEYGRVTINGGSISWGSVNESGRVDGDIQNAQDQANNANNKASDALDGVDDLARGRYIGGTFIDGKRIEAPTIIGGLIEGGELRVNGGVLSDSRGRSEFGIYDQNNVKCGYIRFDNNGLGTSEEARERVFFCTENRKALKIQSGGDMSLDAGDGKIFLTSQVVFKHPPIVQGQE